MTSNHQTLYLLKQLNRKIFLINIFENEKDPDTKLMGISPLASAARSLLHATYLFVENSLTDRLV